MPIIELDALLAPVDNDLLCGLNPKYDPAFLELEKEALRKPEVHYGTILALAGPLDWKRIRIIGAELLERRRVSLSQK